MNSAAIHGSATNGDAPRRVRDIDIKERYGPSRRTAGEWLRAMVAAGILKKIGRITVGRLSAMDAWVEAGGVVPTTATTKRRAR